MKDMLRTGNGGIIHHPRMQVGAGRKYAA